MAPRGGERRQRHSRCAAFELEHRFWAWTRSGLASRVLPDFVVSCTLCELTRRSCGLAYLAQLVWCTLPRPSPSSSHAMRMSIWWCILCSGQRRHCDSFTTDSPLLYGWQSITKQDSGGSDRPRTSLQHMAKRARGASSKGHVGSLLLFVIE